MMKIENIRIAPSWSKSKDQIWIDLFQDLDNISTPPSVKEKKRIWIFNTVAAVILVLILIPSVGYFYTNKIISSRGEHLVVVLPDQSEVVLNAETTISYKPIWWFVSRDVKLTGEAYFKVSPGKKFSVSTDQGTVSVLGTSFNIFDRSGEYYVTCLTGKVKVTNKLNSLVIYPNMIAYLNSDSIIEKAPVSNSKNAISWTNNQFSFVAKPLKDVIAEIERQYNIKIDYPSENDYLYTGSFSKQENPAHVLEIIGKPFGIKLKIK